MGDNSHGKRLVLDLLLLLFSVFGLHKKRKYSLDEKEENKGYKKKLRVYILWAFLLQKIKLQKYSEK